MRFLCPPAIIAAFLVIAVSIPQSLFSQTAPKPSPPKQPAPRQRQSKRPRRAGALAPAINELLKLDPLAPESPDQKAANDSSDDSSEEEEKPPADDTPIKDLVAYWSERGNGAELDAKGPSDKVRQLLLKATEDRPELAISLINFLPETTDAHDRLYKLLEEESEDESYWKRFLRDWLQHNSRYFRDELIEAARGADEDGPASSENLRSLARLDWEAARPILESYASAGKADLTPIAIALLYEHAEQGGDSPRAENYRALLKAIVANRQSPQGARPTALFSLMTTEWNGQEEWVVSLFADPTLNNLREDEEEDAAKTKDEPDPKAERAVEGEVNLEWATGFGNLSHALDLNSERWFPVVSNLVGHNHRTVHQSAVRCLVKFLSDGSSDKKKRQEMAQRLAPWLTEPNWAAADDRSSFIQSLVDLQAPELLSGLVWVLDHDESQENRAAAAEALTQYRDARAIPAMRRALEKEKDEERRDKIVTALAECGGLSDDEMAAAIEAYAKVMVRDGGEEEINQSRYGDSEKPLPLNVSIGRILSESETIEATEGLAIKLFERAKALRTTQPAVARQILRSIEGVPLRVAEIDLVERLSEGWADVDSITLALENRDSLKKSAGDELYRLIKQGGYAAGIAAAILNDDRERKDALEGQDAKAQLALLACSRYLRDKLPVELAGKLLDSPNRALAKAAESYLEVEDSAAARKMVLARHPGEAYILGYKEVILFAPGPIEAPSQPWEERMRREIKSRNGAREIYAVLMANSPEIERGVIVRVRNGKAEISVHETEGRRAVRWLTAGELEDLRSFTSRQEVEDLGPEIYGEAPDRGRMNYQYLRLTKDGGRRIVLDALRRAPKNPMLHEEISGLFHRLSRSGEFITRYAIEDKIPGVEVILADKKQQALMVCGEGPVIRVLVGEKDAVYKHSLAEAAPEWREFSSGKLGRVTDDPPACRVLSMISPLMKNRWNDHYGELSLPTRSGDAWVYSSFGKDAGVWKIEPGSEPAKILSGPYYTPLITP
ncbi:MAG: HEAT repeat domain-containing protein, partial [Blastocatellia bacterium]